MATMMQRIADGLYVIIADLERGDAHQRARAMDNLKKLADAWAAPPADQPDRDERRTS